MKLRPVVAGSFYPGTRQGLEEAFEAFQEGIPTPSLPGEPAALLLPHAGYPYSGAIAALGYRALTVPFETVVVAGPSHYLPFKGVSLFAGESVVTPLGEVEVDREACRFLMGSDPHLAEIPLAFAQEHSVEVHLPMIQTYLPRAKVVPLVMGQGLETAIKPLSKALLALARERKFLFVASSDLSHYPARPIAVEADRQFLEALLTGDEGKVDETDQKIMAKGYPEYYCTHCGKEPVSVLLRYSQGMGAFKRSLLGYRNSGDVTGDTSRVVGYAAVAFCK